MGTIGIDESTDDCVDVSSTLKAGHVALNLGNVFTVSLGYFVGSSRGSSRAVVYGDLGASNLPVFLGTTISPHASIYVVGMKYSSGNLLIGDYLALFIQVQLGTISMNAILNAVADALPAIGRVNIDFLPSFTAVTLTIAAGRAVLDATQTLSEQFAGISDHQGAEEWPSTGGDAVPMGFSIEAGSATLDFKEKISDGLYFDATLDIVQGNSLASQILEAIWCFLPNMTFGVCNTVFSLSAFVPQSGDFAEAFVKVAAEPIDFPNKQQFITGVGEHSVKVTGFGSGGIQTAEFEAKNIDLAIPHNVACSSGICTFSDFRPLPRQLSVRGVYDATGGTTFGKRIQLDLSFDALNWDNAFGITGLSLQHASLGFVFVFQATLVARNGPKVQITSSFTLPASTTTKAAKAKARKVRLQLLSATKPAAARTAEPKWKLKPYSAELLSWRSPPPANIEKRTMDNRSIAGAVQLLAGTGQAYQTCENQISDSLCGMWTDQGACFTHPAFMWKHCQAACDRVPLMRVTDLESLHRSGRYDDDHQIWSSRDVTQEECNTRCASDYRCDYTSYSRSGYRSCAAAWSSTDQCGFNLPSRCYGYSKGLPAAWGPETDPTVNPFSTPIDSVIPQLPSPTDTTDCVVNGHYYYAFLEDDPTVQCAGYVSNGACSSHAVWMGLHCRRSCANQAGEGHCTPCPDRISSGSGAQRCRTTLFHGVPRTLSAAAQADCELRCNLARTVPLPPLQNYDDYEERAERVRVYHISEKWVETCSAPTHTNQREACVDRRAATTLLPTGFTEEECYAQGCCVWESTGFGYNRQFGGCAPANDPEAQCVAKDFSSGEMVCESPNIGETACLALGCCYWTGFHCMSNVGLRACPGVDLRPPSEACDTGPRTFSIGTRGATTPAKYNNVQISPRYNEMTAASEAFQQCHNVGCCFSPEREVWEWETNVPGYPNGRQGARLYYGCFPSPSAGTQCLPPEANIATGGVTISGTAADHLKDTGDGLGSAAYGLCEGDCDNDSDCQSGLTCFDRDGTTAVPGCEGTGTADWDYCVVATPASTDHSFTVGVQIPLGGPAQAAAGFGAYFATEELTAYDALRLTQQLLAIPMVDPPEFTKVFQVAAFEMCFAPGGPVDFYMPTYTPGATCGPGVDAEIELQALGTSAKFTISADLGYHHNELPTIEASVEITNLNSIVGALVDAIVDAIGSILNWEWLLNAIRDFLEIIQLNKFKFSVTMTGGVFSNFGVEIDVTVDGTFHSLPQLEIAPFTALDDLLGQWPSTVLSTALDFIQMPPFADGHPCIQIPGICVNSCFLAVCISAQFLADAVQAVAQMATEFVDTLNDFVDNYGNGPNSARIQEHLANGNIGGVAAEGVAGVIGSQIAGAASSAETAADMFCGVFGCLYAYSNEERRVLSHPNATLITAYILMHGPGHNATMDARHLYSLLANAYDHSGPDVASALQVLDPHANEHVTWGAWRHHYVDKVVRHHVKFKAKRAVRADVKARKSLNRRRLE